MDRMRKYDRDTKLRNKQGKPYINPEKFEDHKENYKKYLKKTLPDNLIRLMRYNAKQDALISLSLRKRNLLSNLSSKIKVHKEAQANEF